MSESDISKMKVADLKRELKTRGLITTGTKAELQERLQAALIDRELSLEDTSISEDILDEVLTDEEEKAALESPTEEAALLPEEKLNNSANIDSLTLPPKKVILKRKNPVIIIPTESTAASDTISANENSSPPEKVQKTESIDSNSSEKTENNNDIGSEKKVVKLSELSLKDRLEMRAKKFGITGSVAAPATDNKVVPAEKDQKLIDTLKKRAERFGCVVSSKIANIEIQEKLKKRNERFGLANSKTSSSESPSNEKDQLYAEKARLRLERFKAK